MDKANGAALAQRSPSSITERLAALKRNGEENWKRRVNQPKLPEDLGSVMARNKLNLQQGKLAKSESANRVECIGNLRERKSKLEVAQQQWQNRIGEKDNEHFTVNTKALNEAGRKETRNKENEEQKDENQQQNEQKSVSFEKIGTPQMRTLTGRDLDELPLIKNVARPSTPTMNETPMKPKSKREVNVPQSNDAGFTSFFGLNQAEENNDIELGELDDLLPTTMSRAKTSKLSCLASKRPRFKARTSRTKSSSNPIKELSKRTDLKSSYIETFSEDSNKSTNNASTPHSHLASEALAGLASVEDFSSVQLRAKDELENQENDLLAYKKNCVMLLQVKGRRCCQTRLVEPAVESVNSGDSFVLVDNTKRNEVIVWHGKLSNVIERARAAELAVAIVKNKQLGVKTDAKLNTFDEDKSTHNMRFNKRFFALLNHDKIGEDEVNSGPRPVANPDQEDEQFEQAVNALTLVWQVCIEDNREILKPLKEFWGQMPKHEHILASRAEQVLIFDFGSELYVWNGRSASPELRRAGANFVKMLYEDDDWPKNHPLLKENCKRSSKRPDWVLVSRVNYRMEGPLFREKFVDWPADAAAKLGCIEAQLAKRHDSIRKSQRRRNNDEDEDFIICLEPFDGERMHNWVEKEPNLILEDKCLGRGKGYYDVEERRQYEVESEGIQKWIVSENGLMEEKEDDMHNFFSRDAFVVKWKYKVALTGRDLKGNRSRHAAVGRDRCAFFFWHGADSSQADRSVAALMTVNMDEEGHPHLQLDQGREHAVFLSLFHGKMLVHKGKKEENHSPQKQKLYLIKGETWEEANAIEVECHCKSLRSSASFILLSSTKTFVWHGKHSKYRENAASLAKILMDRIESATKEEEIEEGLESSEFKEMLKMDKNALECPYYAASTLLCTKAPRLFQLSSLSGRFEAKEIERVFLSKENKTPMPFVQSHLYIDEQPALFLLDTGLVLWLWQGWWPSTKRDDSSSSFLVRWHAERRAAMATLIDYGNAAYSLKKRPEPRLAFAGHEPLELTNLFPEWHLNAEARTANEEAVAKADNFDVTLAKLSRNEYTWQELQQRPLPDGVDPSALERYLSREEFRNRLGVGTDEFRDLPRWKRLELKKTAGLF